jgi:glycosidase
MKLFNALQIMLTSRGIPQLLYGTEIGLKGAEEHGLLRADFPGGFSNSSHNAFTKQGRTKEESKYYNFISKILELRKEHPALSKGKMVHYPPVNNIYVYFKICENEKILNIIKDGDQKEINLNNYSDNLEGVKAYKDLVSGNEYKMPDNKIIKLPGEGPYLFLLK